MDLIERLLNRLSIYAYKSSSDYRAPVVALTVLVIVFLTLGWMAGAVEKKLVFIIDDLELRQATSVTIGANSDVCYKNVPESYLRIIPQNGGFRWEVNPLYHDSLQYFKINNENPNKHVIRNDKSQRISLVMPVNNGKAIRLSLTGADIWRTWKEFKEQKDVLVRHFATYYQLAQDNNSREDSLSLFSQMQRHDVRSFFERQSNGISLIILDEYTTLQENDHTIGYARSGEVKESGEQGYRCKVQFFTVSDYCYMDNHPDKNHFQIHGVNYAMKPTVKLTEWGAGHVMIESRDDKVMIHFPRSLTYVGSVDSLRTKSEQSSKIITLKQNNNAFPTKSDLFLPAFSNAINFDLCNIEFFHRDDSVVIRDNSYQCTTVTNPHTRHLPFAIVPTLNKFTLQTGRDTIHGRVGFINGSFIMSYLYLPLGVLCVLLLLIWLPTISQVRLSNKIAGTLYNPNHLRHYPSYLTLLLLVCMAYCVCKSLMALKLSYTYPYFEKLTGFTPVATALTMLLFFSFGMLLNTRLRHIVGQKKSRLQRLASWLVCVLLTILLSLVFFNIMDKDINQGMIRSYFHDEVFQLLPWRWLDEYGINDTHRSVAYALFFAEAVILLIWLMFDLFWKPIDFLYQRIVGTYLQLAAKLSRWMMSYWDKLIQQIRSDKSLKCPSKNKNRINFVAEAFLTALKTLFPGHFILLILLAFIGSKFGNFGTAFISLLVIIGMTRALTQVTISESGLSRHTVFCEMLFISAIYIIAAMVGDHGYLTNYLGFVMCLVCFFFIMKRPVTYAHNQQTEKRWVNKLLIVLLIIIIALPFVCSHLFRTEDVNYSRMARRVMLYSNFDDLQRNGYRYNESDAEFMVIMSHYMQKKETNDPLSNDDHFLHASISSGQSPVVLNDLCVPVAFFGAFGVFRASLVFFLLLFVIIWLVMQYSLSYIDNRDPRLTTAMQWRLLAMFMWVGTSFYIYLSYIDRLPFTGRLIPGMGIDAVGEALETAILLGFMASVTCRKKQIY